MRYPHVLLVAPQYPAGLNALPLQPPCGPGYIAEELEGRVHCDVLDMALGYTTRDVLATIGTLRPDIIGVSMMTSGTGGPTNCSHGSGRSIPASTSRWVDPTCPRSVGRRWRTVGSSTTVS